MADSSVVQAEDVVPVRSRVSWGAVAAGSVLAVAMYFLLTLLGAAVGLSVGDKTNPQTLGVAAAGWAVLVTVTCLFAGGYVASELSTGENKMEGALYGLLVWAVVFAMLLWLMASGVRAGFNAMVGLATAGSAAGGAVAANTTQADWEAAARRAGVPQERINEWRQTVKDAPADAREAVNDPANRQRVEDAARDAGAATTRVTWYTFLGTFASMLAAAAGGYVGAGPTFRIVTTSRAVGGGGRNPIPVT